MHEAVDVHAMARAAAAAAAAAAPPLHAARRAASHTVRARRGRASRRPPHQLRSEHRCPSPGFRGVHSSLRLAPHSSASFCGG
jgi:hypothetical protein